MMCAGKPENPTEHAQTDDLYELPSLSKWVCPYLFSPVRRVVKEKLIIRLGVETRLAVVTAFHDVNG